MFFILNNNVEDISVGGVFNLLDFIFNEYVYDYFIGKEKKRDFYGIHVFLIDRFRT